MVTFQQQTETNVRDASASCRSHACHPSLALAVLRGHGHVQLAQYSLVRLPRALCASRCSSAATSLPRNLHHDKVSPPKPQPLPHTCSQVSPVHRTPKAALSYPCLTTARHVADSCCSCWRQSVDAGDMKPNSAGMSQMVNSASRSRQTRSPDAC